MVSDADIVTREPGMHFCATSSPRAEPDRADADMFHMCA